MKNSTIATSRTRATADQLIEYRPLPAEWGDVEALHALRAAKARVAGRGVDPSTLEIAIVPEETQQRRTRRKRGTHRRRHQGFGRLAAV